MKRTAWRAMLLSRWSWGASSLRRRVGLDAAAAAAAAAALLRLNSFGSRDGHVRCQSHVVAADRR